MTEIAYNPRQNRITPMVLHQRLLFFVEPEYFILFPSAPVLTISTHLPIELLPTNHQQMAYAIGVFWTTLLLHRSSKTTDIVPTRTTRRIAGGPDFDDQLLQDAQAPDGHLEEAKTSAPGMSDYVCA